jgi:branched-chain amino acid transport system substrate-binding protein
MSKKYSFLFLSLGLICVLIAGVLGSGCSGGGTEKDTIRVGVVEAQSGMYAGFGAGGIFGIKAAVEDINALGGVDVGGRKMKISLSVADNGSDVIKAGTVAENLVTQTGIRFLVSGDEPPAMHRAVSGVSDRYKIPYITSVGPFEPWNALREASGTGWPYTWATGMFALSVGSSGDDFRAGKPGYTVNDTWVEMLNQFGNQTNKKVAVLASGDADGNAWYQGLRDTLVRNGYSPISIDSRLGFFPMATTDFSVAIKEWNKRGATILWGNCPSAFFGEAWKQCRKMDFDPKIVSIGRAPLFYPDIKSWGDDLPWGVGSECWWAPTITEYQGIGATTPASLAKRWTSAMRQPVNPAIGPGYRVIQVLVDAVQRAGSLEAEKVNEALASTDLMTLAHRVKFDEAHFNRGPISFAQWFKTDSSQGWENKVVYSKHSFIPVEASPIFPVP